MPTIIGITTDHTRDRTRFELNYKCVEAVVAAGGTPIVLPFGEGIDPASALELCDGLLMTGGNDPDPSAWGEDWHPSCVPVDPKREAFERRLLAEAETRKLPTLGICFGMQLMSLVRSGSLHQFLPDLNGRDEHRRFSDDDWHRRHIVIGEGRLAHICGEAVQVNTNHRQAVNDPGRGLKVVGLAKDGTIEATSDPSMPFWLGVQWHPERMPHEPAGWPIIAALVEAARAS